MPFDAQPGSRKAKNAAQKIRKKEKPQKTSGAWVFNTNTFRWTPIPIKGRGGLKMQENHTMTKVDGQIYCIGGKSQMTGV